MTVSRFVSMVALTLGCASRRSPRKRGRPEEFPLFGAIEDTQTPSHKGMLK